MKLETKYTYLGGKDLHLTVYTKVVNVPKYTKTKLVDGAIIEGEIVFHSASEARQFAYSILSAAEEL